MTTYHLHIQATDGAWYDTPALRAPRLLKPGRKQGASVEDAACYRAYTFPRPIEVCAEAQRLATSLQAPVRVVETTASVVDTFQPEEAHL